MRKPNIYFKHACLTKAALIAALLLVALWFTLFSQLSLGMGNTNSDGDLLPLSNPKNPDPTGAIHTSGTGLIIPKEIPAEIYARLCEQEPGKWYEPTERDLYVAKP
jgi:hypothetical protein